MLNMFTFKSQRISFWKIRKQKVSKTLSANQLLQSNKIKRRKQKRTKENNQYF